MTNFDKPHNSQRGYFVYELYKLMEKDKDIIVLTGDLGYKMFDAIKDDFKDRFYNCGAAELSMIDIAVGLALKGKKPVVYSITPFLLSRGHEAIRNYINRERIPVILVGSGRNNDYSHDGFSHFAYDTKSILSPWVNVIEYEPNNNKEVVTALRSATISEFPSFISLKR